MKTMKHPSPYRTRVLVLSALLVAVCVWSTLAGVMRQFLGIAFLILGALKLYNLAGFATGFGQYDLIAGRVKAYGYAYPFLELALGFSFLLAHNIVPAALITVVLTAIGTIGVARALLQHRMLFCACLGTFFKIPLTTFTLVEDLAMGIMAALLLLGF